MTRSRAAHAVMYSSTGRSAEWESVRRRLIYGNRRKQVYASGDRWAMVGDCTVQGDLFSQNSQWELIGIYDATTDPQYVLDDLEEYRARAKAQPMAGAATE